MRLRYGFHAGQNPARVNAASPDACAALRTVSTHGVDLRRLLRRRSLCRWLCRRQTAPRFRDTPMETRSWCHVDPRHAWMHFAMTIGTPRCGSGLVSTPTRTRHASMPPARTHAPRCARYPRMAWIYGDCYVADRCFDGYVAAKPRPGFRDTPIEMPMGVSRIDTRIVTSPIKMPMVGSPLNAPMVMSPIDMPTVTSPINMPSAAWPINTPVAHRSPACNLGKAQYPHAARPRRRATGSRRPGPDQTPQWPARSDPMRSRSTKRYFQQLFALYAGLVGAR